MTTPDRLDPDDAWLEAALDEVLGGAAPPDLAARIARASAGAPPDSATAPRAPLVREGSSRRLLVAACILVLGSVPVIAALLAKRGGADATVPPERPARVLYVESSPSWTYRYTKNALLRATESVAFQAFVLAAPEGFEQEHSPSLPALTRLPETSDELAAYDVVLLGDVIPADLDGHIAEARTFAATLAAWVAQGGGLAVLAGPRGMPALWFRTPLIEVMPLSFDVSRVQGERAAAPVATSEGASHPILAGGGERAPLRLFDGSFRSIAPEPARGVLREAAQVLLADQDDPSFPLLSVWSAERGRVAFASFGEIWRLRRGDDAERHARFWTNLVRWLSAR
ncbi:MAG: hypothetical protein IT457_06895 [Planctomycetes bacterium]|nr:hypothetical protein [Planctomycetota bacterium]